MDTASHRDGHANTITTIDDGSVVILPCPPNGALPKNPADGRTAFSGDQELTGADLNAALTQIWPTYQTAGRVADCVRSTNDLMTIGGTTPFASGRNMNEIKSLCFDTTSKWGYR